MSEPRNNEGEDAEHDGSHVLAKQVIRVFGHPLRVKILQILSGGPQSASTLSRLLEESLNNVQYHLRVLEQCNAIEEAGSRQGRGKLERFFRLQRQSMVGSVPLQRLPNALRPKGYGAFLTLFVEAATAALHADTIGGTEPAQFTARPVTVDMQGLREAGQLLEQVDREIERIEKESRERIAAAGPQGAIHSIFGLALFRAAPEISR